MKKNGAKEFRKIEDYLSEYKSIEKEISRLRFETEEEKKEIIQWYKDENIFLSNFDMYKKTDEEIQAQIVEMMKKPWLCRRYFLTSWSVFEVEISILRNLQFSEV